MSPGTFMSWPCFRVFGQLRGRMSHSEMEGNQSATTILDRFVFDRKRNARVTSISSSAIVVLNGKQRALRSHLRGHLVSGGREAQATLRPLRSGRICNIVAIPCLF